MGMMIQLQLTSWKRTEKLPKSRLIFMGTQSFSLGYRSMYMSKKTYIIYIHGGPTGMVVANMAVHSPFFQPANVEGTGSHHSWL